MEKLTNMKVKIISMYNLLKENGIYLLTVFGVFIFLVFCAYFVISNAFEKRLNDEAEIISSLSESLIKSNFENLEASFYEDACRFEKMLEKSNDFSKIEDFLKLTSNRKVLSAGRLDTVYVYGIIRGDFFSSDPRILNNSKKPLWYKKAIEAEGMLLQNTPYVEANFGDDKLISWSKEIFDADKNSIGVINMALSFNTYIKFYRDLAEFKGGYVIFTDADDIVLGHPSEQFVGKHIIKIGAGGQGFSDKRVVHLKNITNYQDKPSYVFRTEMFNHWRLYVVILLEDYYRDLRIAILKAFVICAFCFVLLSVLLVKLNMLSKRASSESKAKSNFLTVMSHEIRTPLNAIIGLAQLEMENKDTSYQYKKTIEKILISGQNLLGIINDILDLSKIENGVFEIAPEEYDTPSLINDVCVVSRARMASKILDFRIFVSPNIPCRFCGDMQRIKQILNNFLSNAIKYTETGFVEFSVAYIVKSGSPCLKFKIIDSGMGIRPEDVPKLFGAYNRLDAKRNRVIEGTGLGLNITKKIADLMNAAIEVKSAYGKGSEFSVSIPQVIIDPTPIGKEIAENLQLMKYDAEKTVANKSIIRAKMNGASVLVVDDVQMNLDVIHGLMEPYGLYIATVTSGMQAINLIKNKNEYDVIFMDHMMPIMDGIEATRIIRSLDSEYAKNVPIIAFTANAMSGNDKMFLEKGFSDFISKPVDIRKLDACLNKWIKKSEKLDKAKDVAANIKILKRYIDFEEGIAQFGSEKEFNKMLASFKKHIPALLKELQNNTGNDYIISVHALKGCARTIFVKELGDRAYELEMAAKNGDWRLVKNKNESLIKDTQNLLNAILED
jgi:signal transduction histidine kinase/DNA-binding response OmpR family regulator